MVEIHNQTNQQTPHKKLPRPAEAGSDQGKRPPEAISSVDRAFQIMGIWGNATPECSLYDLARLSN